MSENLKNLIDSIEENTKTHSQYKHELGLLREEITKLRFTVKEQKLIIQDQEIRLKEKTTFNEIPEDISILKDMIMSQRLELKKNEKDVDILEQQLMDKSKVSKIDSEQMDFNEELINTKKIIVKLTEKNEIYQKENKKLKNQLQNIETTSSKKIFENINLDLPNSKVEMIKSEVEDLINKTSDLKHKLKPEEEDSKSLIELFEIIKKINHKLLNLESVNVKLKKNLETAKITINKLVGEVNKYLKNISEQDKEISEKNIKASALNEKIDILKRQKLKLQNILGEHSNLSVITPEEMEIDINKSRKRILSLEDENNVLNDLVLKLNEDILKLSSISNKISPYDQESVEKIDYLKRDNIQLKKMILRLRENIFQQASEGTIKISLYRDVEEENNKLKEENKKLLRELKNSNEISIEDSNNNQRVNQLLPKYYQTNFFLRIFKFLDDYKREIMIDILIQDLHNTDNIDIKRYIVDLLSELTDKRRVCDALIEIIHKEDWLLKIYLIKAISKSKSKEIIKPLNELLKDVDADVREAALNALKKIN